MVATRGLSHLLWWLPLNIWTRGLRPVDSSPTLLPLTSLSYCLLVCVTCPSTPGLGSESCKFPSTDQSVLLSVGQCKVPLNTWTRGLSPVSSHRTFLPLASLSYCLLASVRCPSTPGLGGLSPVNSHPTSLVCRPVEGAPQNLDSGAESCIFPIRLSFH